MNRMLTALLLSCVAFLVHAEEASPVGNWSGRLGEPEGLRILFHIKTAEDGSMSGTMDSPDQGAEGLSLGKIMADDGHWTIEVTNIGTFEGKEKDGSIVGTWAQGPGKLPLTLKRSGDTFEGRIKVPSPKLKIVFRIEADGDGYKAKLDSPDQGASGLPVDSVAHDGNEVTLIVRGLQGRYTGKIEGDTLTGVWSQRGMNFPLAMTREK